jgi:hypothetical protein
LTSVKQAAEDFDSAAPDMERAETAVRNFLENGRAVMWTLEHLPPFSGPNPEWADWWKAAMAEIRDDAAAQWFYRLRNPVVKRVSRSILGSRVPEGHRHISEPW